MEIQVLEGTLAEIQRQLDGLPCAPEKRLRVIISDPEAAETPTIAAQPLRPTEFRNGVPLLPRRDLAEPITTEFVKRLQDEDDEDRLRAYRTSGR
jgi:hypothetical protein